MVGELENKYVSFDEFLSFAQTEKYRLGIEDHDFSQILNKVLLLLNDSPDGSFDIKWDPIYLNSQRPNEMKINEATK